MGRGSRALPALRSDRPSVRHSPLKPWRSNPTDTNRKPWWAWSTMDSRTLRLAPVSAEAEGFGSRATERIATPGCGDPVAAAGQQDSAGLGPEVHRSIVSRRLAAARTGLARRRLERHRGRIL